MKNHLKNHLIFLTFILCSASAFSQYVPVPRGNANQLDQFRGAVQGIRGFILPVLDTTNNPGTPYLGALTVLPSDAGLASIPIYMSNGIYWTTFLGGTGTNVNDTIWTRIPIAVDTTSIPGRRILFLLHADGLISGGIVTKADCWKIGVTSPVYSLGYRQYTAPTSVLDIDTADATFGRIDRVVVDTFGIVSIITGTPSSTPLPPTMNHTSQWELTQISVPAGSTCLAIPIEIVYDEGLGNPSEWDSFAATATADNLNTDNPFHLTTAVFVSKYTDGSYISFSIPPNVKDTVHLGEIFNFFVYFNGLFSNQFQIQFYNGTTPVGNTIAFNTGYGLNPADSNAYQQVSIPLYDFGLIPGQLHDKIQFTMAGYDTSGAKGFFLDYLQLQTGINNFSFGKEVLNYTKNYPTNDSTVLTLRDGTRFAAIDNNTGGGGGGGTVLDTTFEWSVRDSLSTPAVLPNEGSIYLVGTSPTGQFVGHVNNIATRDSVAGGYTFDTASVGDLLYNATTGFVSQLIGGTWVRIGRAVIHQGGDTYATDIVIGSNDNNSLIFKANNIQRGRFEPNTGQLQIGIISNPLNAYTYLDSIHVGFTKATVYSSWMQDNGGGLFDFYPLSTLAARIGANSVFSVNGNFTNISSGNWLTNYEPLTLQGGNYGGVGTNMSSIILKSEFSNNTTRAIVYDNGNGGTNSPIGAPISLLPTDGNLIVGAIQSSDIQTAKLNVVSTSKGSILNKMTDAQMRALTTGVYTGTVAAGSGYTNNTYSGVALTGGSGTLATANIQVVGGAVQNNVVIIAPGKGYAVSDVLSSAGIGGGTGFTFTITEITGSISKGLLVYNTDSLCYFQFNGVAWISMCGGGSGGGGTLQQATDASIAAVDNPFINAHGNNFNIDSTNFSVYSRGNSTGQLNVSNNSSQFANATDTSGGLFETVEDGVNSVAHMQGGYGLSGGESYQNDLYIYPTYSLFSHINGYSGGGNAGGHTNVVIRDADTLLTTPTYVYVPDADTMKVYPFPTGGGGSQDLQSVTDIGNTTTNNIFANVFDVSQGGIDDYVILNSAASGSDIGGAVGIKDFTTNYRGTFVGNASGLTTYRQYNIPNANGTLALSVNGELADNAGNITVTESQDLQSVTDVGNVTNQSITSSVSIKAEGSTGTPFVWAADENSGNTIGLFAPTSDGRVQLAFAVNSFGGRLYSDNITADREWQLPDASGTLALFGGTARLLGYTVATLPAGTQGDIAFVTDALLPSFLTTVVGGGAVVTPVFFDGSTWKSY